MGMILFSLRRFFPSFSLGIKGRIRLTRHVTTPWWGHVFWQLQDILINNSKSDFFPLIPHPSEREVGSPTKTITNRGSSGLIKSLFHMPFDYNNGQAEEYVKIVKPIPRTRRVGLHRSFIPAWRLPLSGMTTHKSRTGTRPYWRSYPRHKQLQMNDAWKHQAVT